MSNLNKKDQLSPLVQSVLALDEYFSELVRLSGKIQSMDMKSDFDFEHMPKLMNHFAECGQGVSDKIMQMSTALNESRAQAESAAQIVSSRAEELHALQGERQKKMEAFRLLGEKVQALNASLVDLKRPEGAETTEEDRAKISMRLSEFQMRLNPLIEEAQSLKDEAQTSRMKALEQGADSLRQSLLAVSQKIGSFQQPNHLQ